MDSVDWEDKQGGRDGTRANALSDKVFFLIFVSSFEDLTTCSGIAKRLQQILASFIRGFTSFGGPLTTE